MSLFVEVDYFNLRKDGEQTSGDIFLLEKDPDAHRTVCTLSDGLGSGVKANVLANITATMAQKFILNNIEIKHAAQRIMATLPVCSERQISYATFSIVDIHDTTVRVINYDNPPFILHRDTQSHAIDMTLIPLPPRIGSRKEEISFSEMSILPEDRLIFFSDGVSQSGMGSPNFPLGWRQKYIRDFIAQKIKKDATISASDLSQSLVREASKHDLFKPKDDITCGVVYFRKPRHTLVITGAPIDTSQDPLLAKRVREFDGKVIISGGTTSTILARELGRDVTVDLRSIDKQIPPFSHMEGIDLVSEGMLTLSRVITLLKDRDNAEPIKVNAATKMVDILLDSDRIHFIVGTKINEAHQNPDMPIEMGIRRTIIHKLTKILEKKYLKETSLEYV